MRADKQCMVESGTDGYMVVKTDFLRDKELSAKAMGVLAFMLSCSDEWDYSINGLANCMADGKSAIRAAIKELEERGYVHRERVKDPQSGLFNGVRYFIRPTRQNPSSHPLSDFPMSDNPMSENRTQSNINQSSINQSSTYNTSLPLTGMEPERSKNERAREGDAVEDPPEASGDGSGNLDKIIEDAIDVLQAEFPEEGAPYRNERFRRREREIVREKLESLGGEDAVREWVGRAVTAFGTPEFAKWLKDNARGKWVPSLGNVVVSGDWETFSGGSLWL